MVQLYWAGDIPGMGMMIMAMDIRWGSDISGSFVKSLQLNGEKICCATSLLMYNQTSGNFCSII